MGLIRTYNQRKRSVKGQRRVVLGMIQTVKGNILIQ